jgi:NAD(P)-dependent dehydrogenase (short-subunit alcohol dehydrogenase family)
MTGWLEGVSALVTGGGSGIGRAVVDGYVAEGARVTVLDRSAELCEELREQHGDAVAVLCGDATDATVVDRAVRLAIEHAGRLDHLTTCVGLFDFYAPLTGIDVARLPDAFDEIYRVNVYSALLAVQRAQPALAASRGSVTLTLSSSAFYPDGGGVLYGSSKWALRGMVAHLARELAPDIRVNGVAPGGTVGTKLAGLRSLDQRLTADQVAGRDERIKAGTLLGVAPRPSDHVGAYVYLASPTRARTVTGAVINTDGGHH